MSDLTLTPAAAAPVTGEVKATEEYPYASWKRLTWGERVERMFQVGYHPGSGQLTMPSPAGGLCGQCIHAEWEWVGTELSPRRRWFCNVLRARNTIRKKWPGCRSFERKAEG